MFYAVGEIACYHDFIIHKQKSLSQKKSFQLKELIKVQIAKSLLLVAETGFEPVTYGL